MAEKISGKNQPLTPNLNRMVEFDAGSVDVAQFVPCGYKFKDPEADREFSLPKNFRATTESVPTPWVQAWILYKSFVEYKQGTSEIDAVALDEWGALLLLLYFRKASVTEYDKRTLEQWNARLAKALSESPYPAVSEAQPLRLITTADGRITLGAAHPECLLFPAQDRAGWESLGEPFLLQKDERGKLRISARRLAAVLDPEQRTDFFRFLRAIKKSPDAAEKPAVDKALEALLHLLGVEAGDEIGDFRPADLGGFAWLGRSYTDRVLAGEKGGPLLVQHYPLKWERDGHQVLCIPEGLDPRLEGNRWLRDAVHKAFPVSFTDLSVVDDRTLLISGKTVVLPKTARAVKAQDLLLTQTAWTWVRPRSEGEQARPVRPKTLGQVVPLSRRLFAEWAPDAQSYMNLEPGWVKAYKTGSNGNGQGWIECQPDLSDLPPTTTEKETNRWSLSLAALFGREALPESLRDKAINWSCQATPKDNLTSDVQVEVWPPVHAQDWRLYFLRFATGAQIQCGLWQGVSLGGECTQKPADANQTEYIGHLPGYPAALALQTQAGEERGLLIVDFAQARLSAQDPSAPSVLSLDFGTSNSCLAWRRAAEDDAEPLGLSLCPQPLWGTVETSNKTGWIPRSWRDKPLEGFFPTLLWIGQGFGGAGKGFDLAESFARLDLPGLRTDGEIPRLPKGWIAQANLKWDPDSRAFRKIFIEYLLLATHAQLFFGRLSDGRVVSTGYRRPPSRYVFTYPLSLFSEGMAQFRMDCESALEEVWRLAYPPLEERPAIHLLSESGAMSMIARPESGTAGDRTIILDMGGGTLNVCVMAHDQPPYCLESVRLAGEELLGVFQDTLDEGYKGCNRTIEQLAKMLRPDLAIDEGKLAEARASVLEYARAEGGLKKAYHLLIRRVPTRRLQEMSRFVEEGAVPSTQYAAFFLRSVMLHAMAYGMILGASSVLSDPSLQKEWKPLFKVKLAGNGWGFRPYGKFDLPLKSLSREVKRVWEELRESLKADLDACPLGSCAPAHEVHKSVLDGISVGDLELLQGRGEMAHPKLAVALGAADRELFAKRRGVLDREIAEGAQPATYFGVSLYGLRCKPRGAAEEVPVPKHWYEPFKHLSLEGGRLRVFDRVSLAPETYQREETPLHHVQRTFLSLMESGVPFAGAFKFKAWNITLNTGYTEDVFKVLMDEEASVEKSPITVFLERLDQRDAKMREWIARTVELDAREGLEEDRRREKKG